MPQLKKQKKKQRVIGSVTQPAVPDRAYRQRAASQSSDGVRQLVIGAVVALGCWIITYTFTLQSGPNRGVFAGMMAMIALLWSVSFGLRLLKWQRRRHTN
jgi:hypothetical protein